MGVVEPLAILLSLFVLWPGPCTITDTCGLLSQLYWQNCVNILFTGAEWSGSRPSEILTIQMSLGTPQFVLNNLFRVFFKQFTSCWHLLDKCLSDKESQRCNHWTFQKCPKISQLRFHLSIGWALMAANQSYCSLGSYPVWCSPISAWSSCSGVCRAGVWWSPWAGTTSMALVQHHVLSYRFVHFSSVRCQWPDTHPPMPGHIITGKAW